MKNYYYRLGSIEECAQRRRTIIQPQSVKAGANDLVIFDNCIEYEGSVFVPLQSVAERFEIPIECFLADELIDLLLKIKARTGHYPIKQIEL